MSNTPVFTKHLKKFNELSVEELYEIIRLRVDIFVVEQDCPYSDLDGKDYGAQHYFYKLESGKILGYVRILDKGVSYEEMAIGRVVIDEKYRHLKLGHQLMKESMEVIFNSGDRAIRLSAQEHLKKFYSNLGFKTVSEMYLEDGIPHVEMLHS